MTYSYCPQVNGMHRASIHDDDAGLLVAELPYHHPRDAADADARGRMLAAAPDLLAALRYCLPRVHRYLADGAELSKALAAIAKAEGRP